MVVRQRGDNCGGGTVDCGGGALKVWEKVVMVVGVVLVVAMDDDD